MYAFKILSYGKDEAVKYMLTGSIFSYPVHFSFLFAPSASHCMSVFQLPKTLLEHNEGIYICIGKASNVG